MSFRFEVLCEVYKSKFKTLLVFMIFLVLRSEMDSRKLKVSPVFYYFFITEVVLEKKNIVFMFETKFHLGFVS